MSRPLIIGFTGTRRGMTLDQWSNLSRWLDKTSIKEARHGDCVGADEQFHLLCVERGLPIRIYPPIDPKHRAFAIGDVTEEPAPYLERNRAIVDGADVLVATPIGKERVRSGTWATIRYARNAGVQVRIFK